MPNLSGLSSLTQRAVSFLCIAAMFAAASLSGTAAVGQSTERHSHTPSEPVFIDTDIGDDIDDAYAVALALSSPDLHIVGVSGAWGDTTLRARLLKRLLTVAGGAGVPVGAGVPTSSHANFTQRTWASSGYEAAQAFPDGVELLRASILSHPGQLTLIALGPLTDVAELLHRDPVTFHKLRRIVIMGGSVNAGYQPGSAAEPEYNIVSDVPAAAAVFDAGVPLVVLPLDSTIVKLSSADRATIFQGNSPLAGALQELTKEWAGTANPTPTLFDVVPVATLIDPTVCPTRAMTLHVDTKGYTRVIEGKPNVQVCTTLNENAFRGLLMRSLTAKLTRAE